MNKYVESHFAQLPGANIRRSKFKRPFTHKTTAVFGKLCPMMVDEVLPGDTWKINYATLARLAPSIHPTMDNAYMDVYFFYVPTRIVWEDFEKFMGSNDDPWTQDIEFEVPQILVGYANDHVGIGSVFDYFGLPIGRIKALEDAYGDQSITLDQYEKAVSVSALPLRCYVKIWNDWFRDENLQSKVPEFVDSGNYNTDEYSPDFCDLDCDVLPVAKYHDYFTSALPQPQKHGDVLLPLGDNAPVKLTKSLEDAIYKDSVIPSTLYHSIYPGIRGFSNELESTEYKYINSNSGALLSDDEDPVVDNDIGSSMDFIYDPGKTLVADLSNATAATVNQLRLAIQTQKLFEKDARGGTRYTELLRSHFGVVSPDGRLQRSEYLGGKRIPLNMDQILQTAQSEESPLGTTAGWSLTRAADRGIIKSFTEHGYIIGVFCLRTDLTYSQGVDKLWTRKKRLDYYWPVLANIGEMPIMNKQIFLDGVHDDEAFGYQEAWAEYRYSVSKNTGFFRPDVDGSLASWHYGEDFSTLPYLGSEFIKQKIESVDRTLAVESTTSGIQAIIDWYFDIETTRAMPTYSIPGLMDHF